MFCGNCGSPLENGSRFCPACGKASDGPAGPPMYAPPQAFPAQQPIPAPPQTQLKKRGKPSILLILVGILMVLLSVSKPVALVFGQKTTGVISSVEQIIDSSSERADYNYSITYRFTTSAGKNQTGNYTMSRVYKITSLPSIGTPVSVSYLSGFPQVNSLSGRADLGFAIFATGGIGVLLIFLGAMSGKFSRAA